MVASWRLPVSRRARNRAVPDDMPTRRRTFDTERYLDLLDAIYAAATDEESWSRALSLVAEATDTRTAVVMASDPSGGRSDALWTSGGAAEQYRDLYNERYAELAVYAAEALPRLGVGQLYVSEDFVPAREARRTPFYEEFMRPLGVLHNMGCLLTAEPSLLAFLTCARREGGAMFSHAETQLLVRITPHLQRALSVARHLQTAALERATAYDALDRLSVGLVLLDRQGVPVHLNRAADRILAGNDGLRAGKSGLAAALPTESRRLQAIVRSACGLSATVETDAGGALTVTRPSGRRAFGVLVSPIRVVEFPLASKRPVAAVVITDPDSSPADASGVLVQLFGLTAAEAKVARLLIEGLRPQAIADHLEVSINTARTHVKRIQSKIGAHSQGDLVRVLVRTTGADAWNGR